MNILTNQDYENKKNTFLKSHNDWHVETSPMYDNGQYMKTYLCDNDDVITEICRPKWETVRVKVHNIDMDIDIKLMQYEMFSNKFQSVYTYEKY